MVPTYFSVGVSHGGTTFFTGGEYHDQMVRTTDGWRIAERIEKQLWALAPTGVAPPGPA